MRPQDLSEPQLAVRSLGRTPVNGKVSDKTACSARVGYCVLRTTVVHCVLRTTVVHCVLRTTVVHCVLRTTVVHCVLRTTVRMILVLLAGSDPPHD